MKSEFNIGPPLCSFVRSFFHILTISFMMFGCGGSDGADGQNGLNGTNSTIHTSVEAPGSNCANGGVKIEVLVDNVVQDGQTQYICNGNNGENGQNGLPGSPGEPGTPGANGTNATIMTKPEPPGDNCPNGGIKIEVLLDNVVQDGQTQYICNGTNGTNGSNATIQTSTVSPGTQCANGGIKIDVLLDGVVQPAQTKYICNGTDGTNGHDGCDSGFHYNDVVKRCLSDAHQSIVIPAGYFLVPHAGVQGAPYNDGDLLTMDAFAMSKTPVTVAQFTKCVQAGACSSSNYYSYDGSTTYANLCNYSRGTNWKSHPMNCVNWHGAKEYCEWIGGRLPSEVEWEYAATHNGFIHQETKYPWGDNEPTHCVHASYAENSMYCNGRTEYPDSPSSGWVGTSAVGTYSPRGDSPLGLVDMGGNVFEWTSSGYLPNGQSNYYYRRKGGAWGYASNRMVITYYFSGSSSAKGQETGFRCVE